MVAVVKKYLQGVESLMRNGNSSLLLLTANRFSIDSALARRVMRVFIPPPSKEERMRIFKMALERVPTDNVNLPLLAEITEGFTGADIASETGVVNEAIWMAWSKFLATKDKAQLIVRNKDIIECVKRHKPVLQKWISEAKSDMERDPNLMVLFPEVADFINRYATFNGCSHDLTSLNGP